MLPLKVVQSQLMHLMDGGLQQQLKQSSSVTHGMQMKSFVKAAPIEIYCINLV